MRVQQVAYSARRGDDAVDAHFLDGIDLAALVFAACRQHTQGGKNRARNRQCWFQSLLFRRCSSTAVKQNVNIPRPVFFCGTGLFPPAGPEGPTSARATQNETKSFSRFYGTTLYLNRTTISYRWNAGIHGNYYIQYTDDPEYPSAATKPTWNIVELRGPRHPHRCTGPFAAPESPPA